MMTIAFYLKSKKLWENGSLENVMLLLAQNNRDVKFIGLSPFLQQKQFQKNGIKFLKIPGIFVSGTISKIVFQVFIRRILKKHGVTHFVTEELFDLPKLSINAYWYASIVHYNETFLKPENSKRINRCCSSLKGIAVTDELIHSLLEHLPLDVSLPMKHLGMPMENIKYTNEPDSDTENPYFFCKAHGLTLGEVTIILKAFSIFKKRTKSSAILQLLIDVNEQAAYIKKLAAYKFRDDVAVVKEIKITKSEYHNELGCICMNAFPDILYVLEKLQAGQSVILRDGKYKLLFKDAVLYTDPTEKNLADAMILLYNNEQIGKLLKINAAQLMQRHQLQNTSNNLWQLLKGIAVEGPM